MAAAYILAKDQTEFFMIPDRVHHKDWTQNVRNWISKLPRSASPAALMPASNDIELQTRRAFWLLRFWLQASGAECDNSCDDGFCREWGFQKDGKAMLEKPEALEERQKVLKSIITTCRCKSGCKTGRCGCFKEPSSTLCVIYDCTNCENSCLVSK